MRRRDFLQFASSLPALALGAGAFGVASAQPAAARKLIDVHAHVFNATDLPARRFLKIVFLHLHPEQDIERAIALDDRDVVDWLIALFIRVTSGRAPDARAEIAVLDGTGLAPATAARDFRAADEETIRRVAEFLREPAPAAASARGRRSAAGAAKLKRALQRAAGAGARDLSAASADEAQGVARAAYFSGLDVGTYLRWFTLFSMYRHALVDRLAEVHRQQGYEPVLLAPALIDYSKWLGEEVASPLADQVEVMGRISRRPNGPAVHGYVAFDPLREVFHRRQNGQGPSPLETVRSALRDHGFLGVKLYPPMGFKPAGNARGQQYPRAILDALNHRVSADLNRALDDLFALCADQSAPVIAHTAESNPAGPEYARRADPAYWRPVLEKHPNLRVAFAHFGRFSSVSAAAPANAGLPESSWEWTFGRMLAANPERPVYADLSYFSEALGDDAQQRRALAATLRRFVRTFDPGVRHLMFGTDWIMLGVERGNERYTEAVARFLQDECGFDAAAMDRFLFGNAVRFLGLARGEATRERLDDFYRRHNVAGRLGAFDA